LFQFQENLQKLNNQVKLEKILFGLIKQYEAQIVAYQKQQLSKGEDNEGNIIGYYKPATQEIADYAIPQPRADKQSGSPFNFEWTGDFFDGMYLLSDDKSAEVWSRDSKTSLLNIEYSELLGLQDDNLDKVIKGLVYPVFMDEIRKTLDL
jgi:hypothetical protein